MDAEVKITMIGNSVEKGEPLHVSKTPDGIQISPFDAEFASRRRSRARLCGKVGMFSANLAE